ncbi:MAG: class I SAM-dependent methyltransferase, partial [Chitinophagaceae bacterium]
MLPVLATFFNMTNRIRYTHCPVCNSADIKNVLQVKDHTVSEEIFTIAECSYCSFRFTQDVPDQNSIGPYYKSENYISHTNTATGVINKLYHFVRKITIAGKRKLIEKNTGMKTGTLLDAGSGIGSFVNEMKQHGWEATGLEPDADARKVAEELYGLEMSDTEQFYQLPAGHFDAITLWHVLEHVHYLQNYVQQLKNLLKDNGKLFIAVPNYTSTDAKWYKANWAAYDVPRHLYHFSPRSMQILME